MTLYHLLLTKCLFHCYILSITICVPIHLFFVYRESAKTEALRTSFQQSMDELRKEKVHVHVH